jgi:two-component system, sensor histidine kinase and response regulator
MTKAMLDSRAGGGRLMAKEKFLSNTKMLSRWTAALLIGLLVVYYTLTLINTNRIVRHVEMIANHPYPVAVAVGEVNRNLALLRVLPERLGAVRTPDVIDLVRSHYKDIDTTLVESFDYMVDNYVYRPGDAPLLRQLYLDLRDEQGKLLELCGDPGFTSAQAASFFAEKIEPKIDEMYRITATMLSGTKVTFAEFVQLARDSRTRVIVYSSILMFAVIAALCVYLSILKSKGSQEEAMLRALREALTSAQSANAAKSRFLFSMSHDIRTPMNAIIGMTTIAGMHLDDPLKIKDCLGKISASSRHLLGLINDVLDMSKIESGKIALNDEEFVLPELVRDLVAIILPQANAKKLQFDVSVGSMEHERVIGDTLRISQAILNVVGNALKFTEPGGSVKLDICELPPQYHGYGMYQFVVSDTGVGIPEDFLDKIFDPFERVRTCTISKVEGTGLGMAITKNIVDMVNGRIAVASERGKGTTFTLTFPLKLQEDEAEAFDCSALRDLRALVVDDDRDVCENTARMLEDIGMRGEWVLTGAEAVEKAASAHRANRDYHSVIVDWKMPGMDGLETARRIRGIVGDEVPIIILTAYDWTEIEEEAKEAGVDAFLPKPLFRSHLCHALRDTVLGGQGAQEAAPDENAETVFDARVLLVEDNDINMEIAGTFIQQYGCAIEQAWDGEEAVRMIKGMPKGYYKLVFMDIQMPKMDGYEATRRIRQMEQSQGASHIPIVAMSANAFVEDMDKAYTAGMDDYITKPIALEEISNVLKKYVGGIGKSL